MLITIVFIIIAGIAFLTLHLLIKNQDTVIVPELKGKDIVTVIKQLGDLDLNVKIKGEENSENITKDHVIRQTPYSGSVVKKGRDVFLILSKGSQQIFMPDLRGFPFDDARIILKNHELAIHVISHAYDETIPQNHIIVHVPKHKAQIQRDSGVDLLISLGPKPKTFMMDELVGLGVDDAIHVIEKKRVSIGKISSTHDESKPMNIVISQSPQYGYRIVEFGNVDIVINRNTEQSNTPVNITGVRLFSYRLNHGYLKKHIRVELTLFGFTIPIIDDVISPSETLWAFIPKNQQATVVLFEDNELMQTKKYDYW